LRVCNSSRICQYANRATVTAKHEPAALWAEDRQKKRGLVPELLLVGVLPIDRLVPLRWNGLSLVQCAAVLGKPSLNAVRDFLQQKIDLGCIASFRTPALRNGALERLIGAKSCNARSACRPKGLRRHSVCHNTERKRPVVRFDSASQGKVFVLNLVGFKRLRP